eukprot:CAMPEP_0175603216 /NCGR_PEP_ID=MMETSP0096-20121207/59037_1 /TAXON_ID=311494 /ORGANISM="Alexandrium monilatum, Strain CCMP3105" /LENGTH=60 /DNA_ID=CAMNT_0016907911 /DNA_START=121 /DNA_END=300 /DNA_ORIENTATION=-
MMLSSWTSRCAAGAGRMDDVAAGSSSLLTTLGTVGAYVTFWPVAGSCMVARCVLTFAMTR